MDTTDNPWPPERPAKLTRSSADRMVFGVCGGVAEYYTIEVLWVRLVFIFISITSAFIIGPILYLAMAFLMPKAPHLAEDKQSEDHQAKAVPISVATVVASSSTPLRPGTLERVERRRTILGVAIIVVGVIAFINEVFPSFWIGWKVLWPVIIILVGLSFLSSARPSKS
jgi:phage shock protein C